MRETLGYNKNHEDREKNDFYATPPLEVVNILQYESIEGTVLENSCGMGHISEVLHTLPNVNIIATDLVDYGYGIPNLDFLSADYPYVHDIDCIVMNPPFKLIEEFVVKSLKITKKKVLLFARMQFAESESRYNAIFKSDPPTTMYIYVDRVACAKDGDFNKPLSSNMAFAWFVWDKTDINYGKTTVTKWLRRYDKEES